MPKRHYTIYCDESSRKGKYFSNFYGAALVRSREQEAIESELLAKKDDLNLYRELKWTSVTNNYLEKYQEYIDFYFSFVRSGRIKVRIMFTQNLYRPAGLSPEQQDLGYFLLYYQLIKHAFGIQYCNPNALDRVYFSLLFDDVPDTKQKFNNFKSKLSSIPDLATFRGCNVFIPFDQIGEVDSKEHSILQGLDIILGSINFRLNNLHLEKPAGSKRRGKRTIAKEKLYKEINRKIRGIYPNFNIGTSTASTNDPSVRWSQPYRHWRFRSANFTLDNSAIKPR